jgi:hypothetical protein
MGGATNQTGCEKTIDLIFKLADFEHSLITGNLIGLNCFSPL